MILSFRNIIPLFIGAAATITFVERPLAMALEAPEVYALAKQFIVRIDGAETGSGVIIKREGNVYTVLTNKHVMDSPDPYQVTTIHGRQYGVVHSSIKHIPGLDLATFQFTSTEIYAIAEIGSRKPLTHGTTIYLVGYSDPYDNIQKRRYQTKEAEIEDLVSGREDGYELLYDKYGAPGTFGGALLDTNGRLVGINGESVFNVDADQRSGASIPIALYLDNSSEELPAGDTSPPTDLINLG